MFKCAEHTSTAAQRIGHKSTMARYTVTSKYISQRLLIFSWILLLKIRYCCNTTVSHVNSPSTVDYNYFNTTLRSTPWYEEVSLLPNKKTSPSRTTVLLEDWEEVTSQYGLEEELVNKINMKYGNHIQRQILEIQLRVCGGIKLCQLDNTYTSYFLACCHKCSCDTNTCFRDRTCCPDIIDSEYFQTAQENLTASDSYIEINDNNIGSKRTCTPLFLRTSNWFQGRFAFTVANCKDQFSEHRIKCVREYTSDIDVLADVVPCVSRSSLEVFRNRFCAYCHGHDNTDIELLEPVLTCDETLFGWDFPDSKTVFEHVLNKSVCNIEFRPKENSSYTLQTCIPSVGNCNATGRWLNYNMDIEIACHAYTAVVNVYRVHYQNIFCAVCNGVNVSRFTCLGEQVAKSFSFTGLLMVENLEDTSDTQSNHCAIHSILDRKTVRV